MSFFARVVADAFAADADGERIQAAETSEGRLYLYSTRGWLSSDTSVNRARWR